MREGEKRETGGESEDKEEKKMKNIIGREREEMTKKTFDTDGVCSVSEKNQKRES